MKVLVMEVMRGSMQDLGPLRILLSSYSKNTDGRRFVEIPLCRMAEAHERMKEDRGYPRPCRVILRTIKVKEEEGAK